MSTKFQDKLQEFVLPFATRLNSEPHLSSLKNGMTITIPLMIIGGFAMLLAVPPIPATTTNTFLLAIKEWSSTNNVILMAPYNLSIGAISIYVVIGVANALAKEYKLNNIQCVILSLFLFWLTAGAVVSIENMGQNAPMTFLGAQGMFYAIIVSFITCDTFKFFMNKNIKIKLPDQVPSNVVAPFEALVPSVILTICFIILNIVCINITGGHLAALIGNILKPIMYASSSLFAVIILSMLLSLFWFFGIHGNNMISGVLTPITTANLALNAEYYISGVGRPAPLSGAFITIFGNWMSYPAMVLCFFLIAKSASLKSIRKIALIPDLFNINEPLTFGVPVVMNVLVALPIMVANVITCSIAYIVMDLQLVNSISLSLPFTMPGVINLFLTTGGDFRAIVLWLILFALDVIILLPFIKMYDKQLLLEEKS